MTFEVEQENDLLVIRLAGRPGVNDPLLARHRLQPYLSRQAMQVVVDVSRASVGNEVMLVGVLSSIKRLVAMRRGCMRLCGAGSLRSYLRQHRLDHYFALPGAVTEGWGHGC